MSEVSPPWMAVWILAPYWSLGVVEKSTSMPGTRGLEGIEQGLHRLGPFGMVAPHSDRHRVLSAGGAE